VVLYHAAFRCADTAANLFPKNSDEWNYILMPLDEKPPDWFRKTFMSDFSKMFACNVNPLRLNERLTLHLGVFMCPGNVSEAFEQNLLSMEGADRKENVAKIVLPRKVRPEAMEHLRDMNISRATLFPGLDGFAQSLGVSIPEVWEALTLPSTSGTGHT
jgi:hypothetical protein